MYLKNNILNNFKKNKIFKIISNLSNKLNYKSYLIGGYVRNIFLNIFNNLDIDIVTTGDSLIIAKYFSYIISSKKIYIFKRYKTAIVKYKNINIEFVSTRKEFYNIYDNKPYIKKLKNIKDDQIRRDFTINTIAISLNKKNFGKIFDTFNGIKDIKNKIIKTPINPNITFYDDPLRMIRAIRFSTQFKFKIDNISKISIKKNLDRIRIISIERIIQEFNKILLCNKPSIGLKLMYKFGFLSIILPEFINLKGKDIDNINGYSYKDNFIHTLKVLDKISKYTNNLWLRWATLLHDIGKPISKQYDVKKGWTLYKHEIIGSNMIPYIFHKLKLPMKNNLKYVQTIIKYSNLPIILSKENVKNTTIKKFIYKIGKKKINIKDIITLCNCDITTNNKKKEKEMIYKVNKLYKKIKKIKDYDKIYNFKIPITGHDIIKILNIKPSKNIGKIKNYIKNSILKGKIKNNYKEALNLIKNLNKKKL
ncbi:MAG: HD domain-containing protein [Candidatus Shikimatogenerans sp. JK-2022]|nr:HD domain-containing protein [Candidatus Shikimatogenerans bostrichidophilus]MDH3005069.1 HD domain-containing protein [Candidatus Shikimatogenerans bostrichidophilus]